MYDNLINSKDFDNHAKDELLKADSPVFTLSSDKNNNNSQFGFYKLEENLYNIYNKNIKDYMLSLDQTESKIGYEFPILNRFTQKFYIWPTSDGISYNIILQRENKHNNTNYQYVSVDTNGVNIILSSIDSDDGNTRWIIQTLGGKIKKLEYNLVDSKAINPIDTLLVTKEYYNDSELTKTYTFNYNITVNYERQFTYDHGHSYDPNNKIEVQSLKLSKDLQFSLSDPIRIYDLNTKNQVDNNIEQSTDSTIQPYTKSILNVYGK